MQQPALTELTFLAADLDARTAAMDEVQLVLRVVVVQEPFVPGREDDAVDAERRHAERAPDLSKSGPLSELVERTEGVAAHSLRMIPSASSRVNARKVSVCSAPY